MIYLTIFSIALLVAILFKISRKQPDFMPQILALMEKQQHSIESQKVINETSLKHIERTCLIIAQIQTITESTNTLLHQNNAEIVIIKKKLGKHDERLEVIEGKINNRHSICNFKETKDVG